ncbi:MAG TPA: phosphoglycerate mutase family protein [Pyrinomonadaceae bacterium]|nr:phosphoglycerate mutase family protein [Pyrinomonadaceae bacterium]
MKFKAIIFSILLFANLNVFGQNTTFILVRHAEKDVSPNANKTNPPLTNEGRNRAMRLAALVKDCRPEHIFSTTFQRTLSTAAPSADSIIPNFRLQVQFYDYDELEAFAAKLLTVKAKCVLVVGHNTTTPELANMLIKQEKYKALADNEYNKAFFVTFKNGKAEDKIVEY